MAARRGKTQARRNSGNGTPGWVWLIAGAAIAAVVFLGAPGLFKKDGDFLRVGGPRANPDAQPAPVADADVDAAPDLPKPAANAAGSTKPEAKKDAQTQYDFYTLLPGKEVQMSDAELAASARAEAIRQAKAQAAAGTAATGTTPAAVATAPTATAANPTPLPETPSAAASAPAAAKPAATTATPAATTAPTTAAAAAAPDNARYILQAGSFGASGDAESTKAKLAMLGLSARVESAQISGKTVYRVRMGPYGTASELAEAKQKLNGSGLSAIAIKAQ
ncbi:Cell division protein FtsN [Xanthomonas sacchari]|uniref:Cell division protein FtsN n=1 Tax=Xanthomonas sacchari TaxID=56458 RepID=A0ABT3DZ11_9XANT|nr:MULTISPECIES: SPOR domain-containing protein [Xanthomonas]MCW0400755.1 Cell division protein FtsN [Xanthomonas sacchari]MCW0421003.1 Cell division protein FtsN [Xanthomonas sacchari]MDQ7758105.1 SPOR domain-containing protein [Xanthomonas sontii]TYD37981.1 sporulation protein [Xanthomonas sontii]UYK73205.1 SPOR domain-containing protein [Xanthomonas sacchari]